MAATTPNVSPPAGIMMWTVHDVLIENHKLLDRQFHDIRSAGFGGVAVFVRCSRYTWDQIPAMEALHRIALLCRQYHMQCWMGPDPRFISRTLIADGYGTSLLLYGDQIKARQVPHFTPVVQNRFSIRCSIPPRPVHMMHEVAIEYYPAGLAKVYACRTHRQHYGKQDIVDITDTAQFFYNARDHYVEAFGRFVAPDKDNWQVMAFFLVGSSHMDFSNLLQMRKYLKRLHHFARHIGHADCLMWDEPGYTCMYGSLPFSTRIEKEFRRKTDLSLLDNLWKMALDCDDGSQIPMRISYFRILQETVAKWQKQARTLMQSIWGNGMMTGIHDTWHFESADMCDMHHGSLDLWKSLETKSGGFVDLGSVIQLHDPQSGYYANLAAMGIIGRSLGKHSAGRFAFQNLWTVGEDNSGRQTAVMDHCVNIMALFGQRWLAHIYGPAGTIGEEQAFLGSPPLPGYPQHSTWNGYPGWNARLIDHFLATRGQLPWANVLLIYPVESLYASPGFHANEIATDVFRLLLQLVDHHFHVDVISSASLARAKWRGKQLVLNSHAYDCLLFPHAGVMTENVYELMEPRWDRMIFIFSKPQCTAGNTAIHVPEKCCVGGIAEVLELLQKTENARPVMAPDHCWTSLVKLPEGAVITLAPGRFGYSYSGEVKFQDRSFMLKKTSNLARIFFPLQGDPRPI